MVKPAKSDKYIVVTKSPYGHTVEEQKPSKDAASNIAEGIASDVERDKEDCIVLVYELVGVVKSETVTKLSLMKPEFKS